MAGAGVLHSSVWRRPMLRAGRAEAAVPCPPLPAASSLLLPPPAATSGPLPASPLTRTWLPKAAAKGGRFPLRMPFAFARPRAGPRRRATSPQGNWSRRLEETTCLARSELPRAPRACLSKFTREEAQPPFLAGSRGHCWILIRRCPEQRRDLPSYTQPSSPSIRSFLSKSGDWSLSCQAYGLGVWLVRDLLLALELPTVAWENYEDFFWGGGFIGAVVP